MELLHGVNLHPAYPQIMVGVDGRMQDGFLHYFDLGAGTLQALSFLRSNNV